MEELGTKYTVNILSAHRNPEELITYPKFVEEMNIKVIVAGAGGAAALPGMLAAFTKLTPVIGVFIKTETLGGMDSLLSIVQMPTGVPVATVGINNAPNAAILA